MIPKNKEELINEINVNLQKLKWILIDFDENTAKLNIIKWNIKDTKINICNLISYLIWRWELVLKWEKLKSQNITPDFPETWYKWNQLWLLAQKFYNDYSNLTFNELKIKFENTVWDILKLINSKSNNDLYEDLWYEKYTLWRMIQFNTSSPYKNAILKINASKKAFK